VNGEKRNRRMVIDGIDLEFDTCFVCGATATEEDARTGLLKHKEKDLCRICKGKFPFSKAMVYHWHFDFKDGSTRVEWGIIPEGMEDKFLVEGLAFEVLGAQFNFCGCVHLECLEKQFGPLVQMEESPDKIVVKDGQKFWRGNRILTEGEAFEKLKPYGPEPDEPKKEEPKK